MYAASWAAIGRVVDEVDHQLGRVLVLGGLGDEHVVGPERPALVGDVEAEPLLLVLGDDHVARPRSAEDEVALDEGLLVVVAEEAPDDAGVDGRLDLGERLVGLLAS